MNTARKPQSAMALIGNIEDRAQLVQKMEKVPYNPPAQPQQLDPRVALVVNSLFKELAAIFPAWKQAWPDDIALKTAKATWVKAFAAEGIVNIEQIRFGIERCRTLGTDFIPSVGKFIKLCLPTAESMGIPDHNLAFREALVNLHPSRAGARTWSHPAVRHAALQCEMHNLADLVPEKAQAIFDRAYDITIRTLVEGRPLEQVLTGIGHDSQKTELQLAEEYGEWRLGQVMSRQTIPGNAQDCRAQLLAKLNIKRGPVAGQECK